MRDARTERQLAALEELGGSPASTPEDVFWVKVRVSSQYVPKLRILAELLPTERNSILGDCLVIAARHYMQHRLVARMRNHGLDSASRAQVKAKVRGQTKRPAQATPNGSAGPA